MCIMEGQLSKYFMDRTLWTNELQCLGVGGWVFVCSLVACGRRACLVSVFFVMASNGVDTMWFLCSALNFKVM